MKNIRKFGLIVVVAMFCGVFCAANRVNAQVLEVGLTGGLSSYYGDINPIKPFNEGQFGFGAMVRYYQGSRWAFRLAYSNMEIKATDVKVGKTPELNRGFKNNLNDIALIAEFNFLDYFTGSRRNFISPYLFAGVSFVMFNPKALDGTELCNKLTDVSSYADANGNLVSFDSNGNVVVTDANGNPTTISDPNFDRNAISDGTAKYKKYSVSIPFGMGVKYSVNHRIGLALEWRVHWAWTDWLDDCSGYYPIWTSEQAANEDWVQYADPSGRIVAASQQVGLDGANEVLFLQRGDSVKYDFYSFLNFTVAFKFNLPKSKKCNVGADRRYYTYY